MLIRRGRYGQHYALSALTYPWEPSLNLARQNLVDTGMASRIELRAQRLQDIPDRDALTLVWC